VFHRQSQWRNQQFAKRYLNVVCNNRTRFLLDFIILYRDAASSRMFNTTRPDVLCCSIISCASAIDSNGKHAPTAKPGHPPCRASFNARAAWRTFLNTSGQNGNMGAALPLA
jgi:hypothetical protein